MNFILSLGTCFIFNSLTLRPNFIASDQVLEFARYDTQRTLKDRQKSLFPRFVKSLVTSVHQYAYIPVVLIYWRAN